MQFVVLTLVFGLLPPVEKPREDVVKEEVSRLQGTWTVVSLERDGTLVPAAEVKDLRVVIAPDRLTFKYDKKSREAAYNLDPAKRPREIDVVHPDSPQRDRPWPGIFELDGDNLRLCYPFEADKVRPRELRAPAGSGLLLFVLKRERS